MEGYIVDWLQLLFRWLHLITGIAWIGASFYFVWLDNSLREPPQWKKDKGIKGDLWAIHGGGIYEVAKYQLEPETMPQTLHWFKWEAYTTWLTGIVLLTVIYYLGAESYLIDKRVADLSQLQAVSIGVGFLVGGWVIYDLLCRSPLGKNGYAIGGALIIVAVVFSYALTHLFSGRGAYIHMGAVIGTIMVGNVFRVIIPSQKALVAAIETGATPDESWAIKAKLHSTHNNYLTLPVLFIMISNHYPMTYSHEYNWIVLLAIIAITAFARHYFNLEHKGIKRPSILIGAGIATAVLAFAIVPKTISQKPTGEAQAVPSIATVQGILTERCASCHASETTDDVFTMAQGGVMLDSPEEMQQWAPRIKARAIDSEDMPFMNKTGMTAEERQTLGAWITAGAPLE
ncbi:MAG: urate hydroxylase PuuD [Pseudomonadales bacterium]